MDRNELHGNGVITYSDGQQYLVKYNNGNLISSIKKPFDCSEEISTCSNEYVCSHSTLYKNGQKVWNSDGKDSLLLIEEAKKRRLDCDVQEQVVEQIVAASSREKSLNKIATYGGFSIYKRIPNVLFYEVDISENDNFELRKALRSHDIDTVVLMSPGGSVWEALTMAGTVSDKKLKTYVPSGATCASACSFIFFAGSVRVAEGNLGVHQFYSENGAQNEKISSVQKSTQFTTSEIIGFLNEFDTPPWVFEKMFAQSSMYFFSDQQKREISKGGLNKNQKEKIDAVALSLNKSVKMEDKKITNNKKVETEDPVYVTEKVEVFLDPIKSEWDYDAFVVTARNDSKHKITLRGSNFVLVIATRQVL